MSGVIVRQRTLKASFPDLKLPDGRVAESLDRFALCDVLHELGVPGITVHMGKQDLLQAYDASEQARLESIKRVDERTRQERMDVAAGGARP